MTLPGFGTQRFAITRFGRGARDITVAIDRAGRSRTLTVTPRGQ